MMGGWINVGVYPQGNGRYFPFFPGKLINDLYLLNRFTVKTKNIMVQCQINFPIRFSHSCKNSLIRIKTDIHNLGNLVPADTIHSKTKILDDRKDFIISIGFHSIMNMVIIFSCFFRNPLKGFLQQWNIIIIKWSGKFPEFLYS